MAEAGRGLVIVRCGRNSLHAGWQQGDRARDWDLQLCPYEPGGADWPPVRPGHKWPGLQAHLQANGSWRGYDYIWLPDDDIATDSATIAALFERCRRFGAAIAQPALTEDSHWSLAMTKRNLGFVTRAVTYVEVMVPCFRRDVLEQMLPTFSLSHRGAGWGLDYLWAKRLKRQDLYIFDDLPLRHTRPIMAARDRDLHEELYQALLRFLAKHEIRPLLRTLRGWDAEGRLHEADGGAFLWRYLKGYDYLISEYPWVLRRLINNQLVAPRTRRTAWRRLTQNLHWPRRKRDRAA
ncbi:MAG TPA: hypothetical protein VJL84_05085 [Kiloniellales bacterium]|nr:hypothetical protein [Kiloniellales bacterium]